MDMFTDSKRHLVAQLDFLQSAPNFSAQNNVSTKISVGLDTWRCVFDSKTRQLFFITFFFYIEFT